MARTIKEERLRWILPIIKKEVRLVDSAKVCPHGKRSLERWVALYKNGGEETLEPKSTEPKSQPKETSIRIKERIIEIRKHTKKCALKIHWQLQKEGIKIDTASRWRYLQVFDEQTTHHSILFLIEVIKRFPHRMYAIKTDNGQIFTNYYLGTNKRSDMTVKTLHALDVFCLENNITHYLIDPGKPAPSNEVTAKTRRSFTIKTSSRRYGSCEMVSKNGILTTTI